MRFKVILQRFYAIPYVMLLCYLMLSVCLHGLAITCCGGVLCYGSVNNLMRSLLNNGGGCLDSSGNAIV